MPTHFSSYEIILVAVIGVWKAMKNILIKIYLGGCHNILIFNVDDMWESTLSIFSSKSSCHKCPLPN